MGNELMGLDCAHINIVYWLVPNTQPDSRSIIPLSCSMWCF